jgi:hypothetical protein
MNKLKIFMSCFAIIALTLGFSPQISKGESMIVAVDSKLVSDINRTFSYYPPSQIYYEDGTGYGGWIDLQNVQTITSGYRAIYGGEIYPVCTGGICPYKIPNEMLD